MNDRLKVNLWQGNDKESEINGKVFCGLVGSVFGG